MASIKKISCKLCKNKKSNTTSRIFIPSTLECNELVFFAIDNVYSAIDTPDGKRQLHGTGTTVYQEIGEGRVVSYFFFFSIKLEMPLDQGRYIRRTTIFIFSFCIGLVAQLNG